MKEKEKEKEIDRFRFLILGAAFAFFVGLAANFFYDLLIGTDFSLTKALLIGLIIVFPLSFLFLGIKDKLKDLGYFPPKESDEEANKWLLILFKKHFKTFIKVIITTVVFIFGVHHFHLNVSFLKDELISSWVMIQSFPTIMQIIMILFPIAGFFIGVVTGLWVFRLFWYKW